MRQERIANEDSVGGMSVVPSPTASREIESACDVDLEWPNVCIEEPNVGTAEQEATEVQSNLEDEEEVATEQQLKHQNGITSEELADMDRFEALHHAYVELQAAVETDPQDFERLELAIEAGINAGFVPKNLMLVHAVELAVKNELQRPRLFAASLHKALARCEAYPLASKVLIAEAHTLFRHEAVGRLHDASELAAQLAPQTRWRQLEDAIEFATAASVEEPLIAPVRELLEATLPEAGEHIVHDGSMVRVLLPRNFEGSTWRGLLPIKRGEGIICDVDLLAHGDGEWTLCAADAPLPHEGCAGIEASDMKFLFSMFLGPLSSQPIPTHEELMAASCGNGDLALLLEQVPEIEPAVYWYHDGLEADRLHAESLQAAANHLSACIEQVRYSSLPSLEALRKAAEDARAAGLKSDGALLTTADGILQHAEDARHQQEGLRLELSQAFHQGRTLEERREDTRKLFWERYQSDRSPPLTEAQWAAIRPIMQPLSERADAEFVVEVAVHQWDDGGVCTECEQSGDGLQVVHCCLTTCAGWAHVHCASEQSSPYAPGSSWFCSESCERDACRCAAAHEQGADELPLPCTALLAEQTLQTESLGLKLQAWRALTAALSLEGQDAAKERRRQAARAAMQSEEDNCVSVDMNSVIMGVVESAEGRCRAVILNEVEDGPNEGTEHRSLRTILPSHEGAARGKKLLDPWAFPWRAAISSIPYDAEPSWWFLYGQRDVSWVESSAQEQRAAMEVGLAKAKGRHRGGTLKEVGGHLGIMADGRIILTLSYGSFKEVMRRPKQPGQLAWLVKRLHTLHCEGGDQALAVAAALAPNGRSTIEERPPEVEAAVTRLSERLRTVAGEGEFAKHIQPPTGNQRRDASDEGDYQMINIELYGPGCTVKRTGHVQAALLWRGPGAHGDAAFAPPTPLCACFALAQASYQPRRHVSVPRECAALPGALPRRAGG